MEGIYFLLFDTSNFWVANWYYFAAVLIALTSMIFGIKNYLKKSSNKANSTATITQIEPSNPINATNTNTNTLTVNIGPTEPEKKSSSYSSPVVHDSYEKQKQLIHTLFIDDDVKFKIVKIIKNNGWGNTKSIVDIGNYDDDLLKRSHIVFVDVQGVGKLLECKDEGLGLALNIKNKYPQKKVVIYSAVQTHKVFHEAIQKVDFLLSKDAEPFEFISLIERFSKEIDL